VTAPPPDIRLLFEPRGVAVIGASREPGKIGRKIIENLLSREGHPPVYPVNPNGGELLGLPVARSVGEIAGTIDIACIAIPAPRVLAAAEECARAGVRFLVVVSSGFSEVGNVEEERKLVELAHERGLRVLGPNIFGLFVAESALNCGFAPADIRAGNLAIITQSGAMGGALIGQTAAEGIGLSSIVPVGNKADIDEADLLAYLREDPRTEIILIYLEGVKQGQRLTRALAATTRVKPVVVIKSGRSQRGAMAAASHTGSLAGSDAVCDDILRQSGALRAEHLQEALAWCKFLGSAPPPPGENIVIVTNGGGAGVAASDACEKYDVRLHDGIATLQEIFGPFTPPLGSTKNPVDLTGQAAAAHYERALAAAVSAPSVHGAIVIYCETALLGFETLAESIARAHTQFRAAGKPVAFVLLGGVRVKECVASLRTLGVPVFEEVYTAASCLGALYAQDRVRRAPPPVIQMPAVHAERILAIAGMAREDGRGFLHAHEGRMLLRSLDIETPRTRVARSLTEAVAAADAIGYPVVLKVVSKDILHKSDAGGVALDLENRAELMDAYQAILHNCRQHVPAARIEGVEVAEQIGKGVELIVGARRDAAFGPIVMFGLGGVYVEVLGDVAFRSVPVARSEIEAMIKQTRAHRLLLGVRGEARRDERAAVDALLKLGAVVDACPQITDIEINPLVVFEEGRGARALDIRVMLG
jgi:acetate---CoA ligase (ADP-forming)